MAAGKIFIGASGWNYRHWKGTFYPEDLKTSGQLDFYGKHFNTVELNNSFYRLPPAENFTRWRNMVPPDFVFAVKANRYITHMKKLSDPQETLHDQLRNIQTLGPKMGPLLFQLPPKWNVNTERFLEFLLALPKKKFRFAFEFRDHSWYDDAIYRLLASYNCAFCIYQLAGHTSPIITTADFVYVRLHGPGAKYQGSYKENELQVWAARCLEWSGQGKDVFLYFDNDQSGFAAFNAKRLSELVNNGK